MGYSYATINVKDIDGVFKLKSIVQNKKHGWVFCDDDGVNEKRRAVQAAYLAGGQSAASAWFHAFNEYPQLAVPKE